MYVGSSARDPELRYHQHRRGYKSSGIVKRFARRLRPDLYEDLAPLRGAVAGRRAEEARARELAGAGFVAHSDGTSFGKEGGEWREWDAARLEPVAAHVDAAAAELIEASFERLSALRCAMLLHGDRGFWLGDHIDPDDPPPAYGLFAHVRPDVLEARARRLLG